MDKIDKNVTEAIKEPEPPTVYRRIGSTTYEISMYFSQTSNETIADKIKRLIQNDIVSP